MSADFVGKVPKWMVKFALNNVIRKSMIRYNTVKLPEDKTKWRKLGAIVDCKSRKREIDLILEEGEFRISSIDNGIVQISVSKSLADIPKTNAIIIENKNAPPFIVKKSKNIITIQQESDPTMFVQIEINKDKGELTFKDGFGFGIFSEELPSYHEDGWYRIEKITDVACGYHYGFGEKGGPLDKKGEVISFWNTDSFAHNIKDSKLYQSQPIQITVRPNGFCYALVYDNPCKSQMKIEKEGECKTQYYVAGGGINYYLIIGPSTTKVFGKLSNLLGKAPIPPIAALGHHQSRLSYYPETEVRALAAEFRKRKIPCDFIHLDIDYLDEYRVFTWDEKRFPDPKKLSEDLLADGFRLMAMTDPGIKVDSEYFMCREGIENGHFCVNPDGSPYIDPVWPGDCHFPDFTQAKTREWFGKHFSALTDVGIQGFWIDMNEPSLFNEKGTIGDDVIHPSDGEEKLHKEVHNIYGHLMSQATYEGVQKLLPNKRIYVNSRSAYLGTHRYAGTWTGDNIANWSHFQISLPMLLNMAASGQVMIGPDIGGFFGKPSSELLIRWYQAGCFYPYFRNHTINKKCSQEPWVFGKKTENIIRETIQLRYSLMVYIFNSIRNACTTGIPAFRALWIDYPKDPMVHIPEWSETEYLFGDNLLISPILKKGKKKREVYLPRGKWYSYEGEIFDGGRVYEFSVPLDKLLIFVKAGSILPCIKDDIQHTGEIFDTEISLRVYPYESTANSEIYLDDGDTLNYLNDDYEIAKIEVFKKSQDTWYVNVKREGKKKKYIKIRDVKILGEEKANYLVFEK